MASKFVESLRDYWATIKGKGRTGPFSRRESEMILSLAKVRNRIAETPDSPGKRFITFAMAKAHLSNSQIFQDLFVLYVLGEKKTGFYCDFGATNGDFLSNSYCLDIRYGWKGICAEPARSWHEDLKRNRPNALIETDCVWSRTGEELQFLETRSKELSTLQAFGSTDNHARRRRNAVSYNVRTISLNDMLERHGAPVGFDYLSMDTEGSEFDILQAFDIARFVPKVITVEHNYTPKRNEILGLLTKAGYTRVLTEVSLFDDWYLAPGVELPNR